MRQGLAAKRADALGVLIERALPVNAEEILLLERECFSTPWTYDNIMHELTSPISEVWIARVAGGAEAVGYLSYKVIADELHIGNVAVKALYRRQGIAGALISTLLTQAKTHHAGKATLEVRVSNTAAISLYTSYGFVAEGIRKEYYDDGEDALIMWRYDCEQTVSGRQNLL